jgi:hypothetical protein
LQRMVFVLLVGSAGDKLFQRFDVGHKEAPDKCSKRAR